MYNYKKFIIKLKFARYLRKIYYQCHALSGLVEYQAVGKPKDSATGPRQHGGPSFELNKVEPLCKTKLNYTKNWPGE